MKNLLLLPTSGCFASLEISLNTGLTYYPGKTKQQKLKKTQKESTPSFCHVLFPIAAGVSCSCIDIFLELRGLFPQKHFYPEQRRHWEMDLGCRPVPGRMRPKHGPLHTFKIILIGKCLIVIYHLQQDEKSIEGKTLKTIRLNSIKCTPQVNEQGIQY